MRLPKRILVPALFALPLLACDGLFDQLSEPEACLPAPATVELTGAWTISGDGNRDSCDDDVDDGSIEFRTESAIAIRQDPTSGALQLFSPGSLGQFTFSGSVQGDCVQFETGEGGAADLAFSFVGTADDPGSSSLSRSIGGKFRSEGPGACVTTGTFKVEVR